MGRLWHVFRIMDARICEKILYIAFACAGGQQCSPTEDTELLRRGQKVAASLGLLGEDFQASYSATLSELQADGKLEVVNAEVGGPEAG